MCSTEAILEIGANCGGLASGVGTEWFETLREVLWNRAAQRIAERADVHTGRMGLMTGIDLDRTSRKQDVRARGGCDALVQSRSHL